MWGGVGERRRQVATLVTSPVYRRWRGAKYGLIKKGDGEVSKKRGDEEDEEEEGLRRRMRRRGC